MNYTYYLALVAALGTLVAHGMKISSAEQAYFYDIFHLRDINILDQWYKSKGTVDIAMPIGRARDNRKKAYPLHILCLELKGAYDDENIPLLSWFLEHCANPNSKDSKGRTPACYLFNSGVIPTGMIRPFESEELETIKTASELLLEKNADFTITYPKKEGAKQKFYTPLHDYDCIFVNEEGDKKLAQILSIILRSCNTSKFSSEEMRCFIAQGKVRRSFDIGKLSKPKRSYSPEDIAMVKDLEVGLSTEGYHGHKPHSFATFLMYLPITTTREILASELYNAKELQKMKCDYLDQTSIFYSPELRSTQVGRMPQELRKLLVSLVIRNNVVKDYFDAIDEPKEIVKDPHALCVVQNEPVQESSQEKCIIS